MEYTSPPPREEDRGFEGGGLNPINPWAALWRDRGLLVIALVGLALLAAIAVTALTPERNLLREVTLKSERGLTDFGEVPSLSRGERFRLELNLPKPASILVFLEDPQGALSRVHPPAGEEAVLAGPWIRLPPDGEAWEAGGREKGRYWYALWLFAAPRPFSAGENETFEKPLQVPAPGDRQARRSFLRNLRLGRDVEAVIRPFVVKVD